MCACDSRASFALKRTPPVAPFYDGVAMCVLERLWRQEVVVSRILRIHLHRMFRNGLLLLALLLCIGAYSGEPDKLSDDLRSKYIKEGQVWHSVDVPHMDILAGPQNEIAVPLNTEVVCKYVEPTSPPVGTEPKFKCKSPTGELLRVKYGRDNREVYAQVAATRLFWALGFYADEVYPVKIKCLGCPEKSPFHPEKGEKRIERFFEYATMTRNFPGVILEQEPDQGWTWTELEQVDDKAGGAPRAQIDALKLLAAFIQHADNKHIQQRLACYQQDIANPKAKMTSCKKPILMIADMGASFSEGTENISELSKMDLESWKKVDIWDVKKEAELRIKTGKRACVATLTNSKSAFVGAENEGLSDPIISEAGRKLLSHLLNELTDQQIEDLFRVARADQAPPMNGEKASGSLQDWVAAFKEKRKEISDHTCE